jgi:acetyl-CoA synthetase
VSIYYTAPTLIHAFMKWGNDIPDRYDLSSLRVLGGVGAPVNPEVWMSCREHIGHNRRPLEDVLVADPDGGCRFPRAGHTGPAATANGGVESGAASAGTPCVD